MWRQKHKNKHGTWDKKNLTPPPIRICPLFDELKKGDFFTPLPPVWTNVSFSAIFFLKASLINIQQLINEFGLTFKSVNHSGISSLVLSPDEFVKDETNS